MLQLMNHEGTRATDRLDYIGGNYMTASTLHLKALLEEGRREGVLRDVPVATVFLMLAHGGGALFCLRPLAKQLGTPTRRSAETIRAQAEEITETLVRGLVTR